MKQPSRSRSLSTAFRIISLASLSLFACIGTGSDAAQQKTFVYAHDRGDVSQVFAFELASTGALTPVVGSPFNGGVANTNTLSGNIQTAAYSSRRKLLFASSSSGVLVWQVATTGELSLVPGSPFGPGGSLFGVGVVEKGPETFVYCADLENELIRGYRVEADSTLTELDASPVSTDSPGPLSAVGSQVFVGNLTSSGTVAAFHVTKSGDLIAAPGSPFALGAATSPFYVGATPSGKSVYVPDEGTPDLFEFAVKKKTGALAPLPGSPVTTLLPFSSGLAVTDQIVVSTSDDLQVFKRLGSGRLQALGGLQSSGFGGIESAALTSNNKILVAGSSFSDTIETFLLNKSTGVLTPADSETAVTTNLNQILVVKR
jgi:hypothetical protein